MKFADILILKFSFSVQNYEEYGLTLIFFIIFIITCLSKLVESSSFISDNTRPRACIVDWVIMQAAFVTSVCARKSWDMLWENIW